MKDFEQKTWFVTGASTGLGRALAEEVIVRKGRLVATARDPSSLSNLAARGSSILTLPLDVTNDDQINSAVAEAERHFGRIDILANCAGYGLISTAEEANDVETRAQFDVNFFGLASVTRAVLPIMRRQRSGHIVNFSSLAGICGMPGVAYYCASKFAVEGLSEALAREVAPFGISVLIVEPGQFRTDFSGRSVVFPTLTIDDYEAAHAIARSIAATHGTWTGNPKLAAIAIVETIASGTPPQRLVLGESAFDVVSKALRDKLADIERSRAIASTVSFPKAPS